MINHNSEKDNDDTGSSWSILSVITRIILPRALTVFTRKTSGDIWNRVETEQVSDNSRNLSAKNVFDDVFGNGSIRTQLSTVIALMFGNISIISMKMMSSSLCCSVSIMLMVHLAVLVLFWAVSRRAETKNTEKREDYDIALIALNVMFTVLYILTLAVAIVNH